MALKKDWREGEMILTFGLQKIVGEQTTLVKEWVNALAPITKF